MKSKTLLFIYNPKAGKAHIRSKLAEILEIFNNSEYEITVLPTGKAGDAGQAITGRSRAYDLFVVAGGDGTLAEAVTALIHSGLNTPIGYIPAGSTNDFGSSINLPKDMIKAAKIAVEGKAFKCDVGIFNRDVFVYIAAFGLFTDVSYETGQDMKNLLGHMAYLLEGMKRLPSIRSYAMKVTSAEKVIEDEFVFGMITNSVSVGGFKRITGNNVKFDDGVFEVTLIRQPKNPIELNNIMMALLNRDIDAEEMYCFNTSSLELESAELLPWTLDGEYGGSHTHVRIENRHQAITIHVGDEAGDVISAE
jgi:YegS/Rv2252/BmrU family lipid kinase